MQSLDLSGYRLRYVAGLYWLLDITQPGVPYQKPVPLNETGAEFFRLFAGGSTKEEIAGMCCREFGLSKEEALQDIEQFQMDLRRQGVRI